MRHFSVLVLAFFLFIPTTQAQFLKKLKEKVEQKVENTVTDNIANKAANEADKSLNNIWETNLEGINVAQADYSEIPDVYRFNWKYDMKMETKDGTMDIVYLLNEAEAYMGTTIDQNGSKMIMVFHPEKNLNTMFMESDGSKMVMASKVKVENEAIEENAEYENMKIREIEGKEILGYQCSGYEMENEDYIMTTYVTNETGLSFTDIFKARNNPKISKSVNADWIKKHSDGMMLEMHMVDKDAPMNNMKMYCTSLKKENTELRKSDYQNL